MNQRIFFAYDVEHSAIPDYMVFGPEGKEQPTLVCETSLPIPEQERHELERITATVGNVIRDTQLTQEFAVEVGVSPDYARDVLEFDSVTGNSVTYFGLDLIKGPDGKFRIIEINPNNQSFLQRPRAASIGQKHENDFVSHQIERMHSVGVTTAAVIGSKKNAYWRSHVYLAQRMAEAGIDTAYTDIEGFSSLLEQGFYPDMLFRCCNTKTFLYSDNARPMIDYARESTHVTVSNSLSAPFFGYRKFLQHLQAIHPDLLPLTSNEANAIDTNAFPWLKYEGRDGFSLVTNLTNLRRWHSDAILVALSGDYESAMRLVEGKVNSAADSVRGLVASLQSEGGSHIFQEHISPSEEIATVQGRDTKMSILYRTTGVLMPDGNIHVSHELYGCSPAQLGQSHGKINAGTGIYIVPTTV